jgi:hypothetical protein
MSKAKKSKLDQFTARLDEWFGVEKKTIAEVQAQLKLDGCVVSAGRLSQWWSARQSQLMQSALLQQISSGASACKEVELQFAKNPAPELETLIKLHRVLVMKLSTAGNVNPELLELVSSLMKPVMEFAKLGVKQDEVALTRQKFQRETCELFIKWFVDEEAKKILSSNLPTADKTERLGQRLFGDLWQ